MGNETEQMLDRDRRVLGQVDGHMCYDWDGLSVSALTPEYDCCVCYKKTLLGRFLNRVYMLYWNWKMYRVCKNRN